MSKNDMPDNAYAWILGDVRIIQPFPIKRELSLEKYDGEVEYLNELESDEEDEKMYYEIWELLLT